MFKEPIFKKNHRFTPQLLMFCGVLMVASIDIYLPAAPYMANFFKTSKWLIQISLMLSPLIASVTGIFYGYWSDAIGRRVPLLCSLLLFSVGSLLCAFSKNIETFLFYRIIQSIGGGGISVISISIIADLFSGNKFAKIMATISMMFPILFAVCPLIGAYLFTHYNWQANFILLFLISFILFVYFLFYLNESIGKKRVIIWHHIASSLKDLLQLKDFIKLSFAHGLGVAISVIYVVNSAFIFIKQLNYSAEEFATLQLIPVAFNLIGSILLRQYVLDLGARTCLKYSLRLTLLFLLLCLMMFISASMHSVFFILFVISIYNISISSNVSSCASIVLENNNSEKGLAIAVLGLFRNGMVAIIAIFSSYFISNTEMLFLNLSIFSFILVYIAKKYWL